jgi:hypothetical protein
MNLFGDMPAGVKAAGEASTPRILQILFVQNE